MGDKHKSQIPVIEPEVENFILDKEVFYVECDGELELIDVHLECQRPLCFQGNKGVGKTLAFAAYAREHGIPIVQFDCSEGTKYSQLYGSFVLEGDDVVFKPGALPTAYMVANAHGKAILVLEELNALTPQCQKMLCPVTDYRAQVYVPEIGRRFFAHEDTKLLIGATMNPSFYGGVSEINEDLKSRFSILDFEYPTPQQEAEIMRCDDKQFRHNLLHLAVETRKGKESSNLDYALSPRDLCACVDIYNAYKEKFDSDEKALKMMLKVAVLGKFESQTSKETLRMRINSIFNVEVE